MTTIKRNNAALLFLSVLISSASVAEENKVRAALADTMTKGRELYLHIQETEPRTIQSFNFPNALTQTIRDLECRGHHYNYYDISHNDGASLVYGIAVAQQGGVMIGRHIAVSLGNETEDVVVTASSTSCLELQKPSSPGMLFATHFLTFTPNVFHVYESIVHNTTIHVGTDLANWKVHNGEIAVVR